MTQQDDRKVLDTRRLTPSEMDAVLRGIGIGYVSTQSGGQLALGQPNDRGGVSIAQLSPDQAADNVHALSAVGVHATVRVSGSPGKHVVVFAPEQRKIPERRLFIGKWLHVWSWCADARAEADCRFVVDLAGGQLVAGQVFDHAWRDLTSDEKGDLAQSLFGEHLLSGDPKAFDLVEIDRVPTWAITASDDQGLPPYLNGEVLGLDREGRVMEWNECAGIAIDSGQSLQEFGLHNLREHELARIGVSREAWAVAGDAHARLESGDITQEGSAGGARLFMAELLDSVEALSGIVATHGARTLADLMYLQNAILNGSCIEHYPGESAVQEIVAELPSADRWMKHVALQEPDVDRPSA